MKLQISFDFTDLEQALAVAKQVAPYADIIEIGSLLLYKHGTHAIEEFRKTFPNKVLLADAKIVDRGRDAAQLVFDAGADWITVMGGTNKKVIYSVATVAHERGKKVMLDLVDSDSPGQSALESKTLGVDALVFHQAYDEQASLEFLDQWSMVEGNSQIPVFVSAHISRDNIEHILELNPSGIVVGTSITTADDPAKEAQFFKELCDK